MTTYAGEVRIKTKLDAKGINEGMKKVSKSLENAGAIAVKASAGALVGIVAVAGGIAIIVREMMKMDGFKEKFKDLNLSLKNLQNAAYSALMPMIEALLPTIMQIVTWLTHAANVTAAFFAKLAGSTTYSVYVSGEYADNMERAEKAAKGTVASFDKLNVLNKQEESAGPRGGGLGGGWVAKDVEETLDQVSSGWKAFIDGLYELFTEGELNGLGAWFNTYVWEPIVEFSARTVNSILKWFSTAWGNIKTWAIETWETIKKNATENMIEPIKKSFKELWDSIKNWAIDTWTKITTFAVDAWNKITTWVTESWVKIKEAWQGAKDWFNEKVLSPIKTFFMAKWDEIKTKVLETWEKIKEKWALAKAWFNENVLIPIKTFFTENWEAIRNKVIEIWESVKEKWQVAKDWFKDNVTEPLKELFDNLSKKLKEFMEHPFESLGEFVRGIFNGIIGFLNGLLNGLVNGINNIIGMLNSLSFELPNWKIFGENAGRSFGVNIPPVTSFQIPHLATGAVIPPNAPFAAILGDQKSGVNVEAPLSTIEKAVENVLARRGNTENRMVHAQFYVDGRILFEAVEKERKRLGTSMLTRSSV